MPTTTTKGIPAPVGADSNNVPTDMLALGNYVDGTIAVQDYTTAQITAFTAAQKWAGRLVRNSTTGKWVRYNSGSSSWDYVEGRVAWRLRRVAAQTIPNASSTAISWDTEDEDTETNFTPHATTGTTITIPTGYSSYYSINVQITATSDNNPEFYINAQSMALRSMKSLSYRVAQLSHIVWLNAADTIQVVQSNNSGGSSDYTGFFTLLLLKN